MTAAVALVGAALLVTACAPSAQEAAPEKTATSAPIETAAPQPAATPTGQPATVGDDPTCETIISPTTVADFESLGWTTLSDEFRVASVDLPGGVQCIWGDFSTASDHVQIFGWAPITAAQTDTAVSELLADGWRREDGPDGVYVTEKSETAVATDAEGYGLTYLFGDGWVTYADTKQGLVLVEWPPS
jgi:hypothetical protein